MNKSEQVQRILQERYPCQEAPPGTWKKIAEEVGCSGELVRQIATAKGIQQVSRRPPKLCKGCGVPFGRGDRKRYCLACREIPVACDRCGKVVMKIRAEALRALQAKGPYAGRAYCSFACSQASHRGKRLRPRAEGAA